MNNILKSTIDRFKFGSLQVSELVSFLPLLVDSDIGPEYITLSDALAAEVLTVTETSADGSVPNLAVTNLGDVCVLIIDGEELIGAKQNRSANASMLLAPHSKTTIPVSCTERGRWSTREDGIEFKQSDNVMERRVRRGKLDHVTSSLRQANSFVSHETQNAVWSGIEDLSDATSTSSPTDAMRDVFEEHKPRLDRALANLTARAGQCGSVFFIGGRIAGCEIVSRRIAYTTLHEKLIRSYALDSDRNRPAGHGAPSIDEAVAFLAAAAGAPVSKHESVGLGEDLRINNAALIGSVLVYEDTLIHMAAFAPEAEQAVSSDRMASYRTRRLMRE